METNLVAIVRNNNQTTNRQLKVTIRRNPGPSFTGYTITRISMQNHTIEEKGTTEVYDLTLAFEIAVALMILDSALFDNKFSFKYQLPSGYEFPAHVTKHLTKYTNGL